MQVHLLAGGAALCSDQSALSGGDTWPGCVSGTAQKNTRRSPPKNGVPKGIERKRPLKKEGGLHTTNNKVWPRWIGGCRQPWSTSVQIAAADWIVGKEWA